MSEKNLQKTYHLRNSYLLGMIAASAIVGISCPASANSQIAEANQPTVINSPLTSNNIASSQIQTETVDVQRKIVFHIFTNDQVVFQKSQAHRQVTIDPVTKKKVYSEWTVDPFEEVNIPQVKGMEALIDSIPTVVHIHDLSYFNKPLDVFYHPIQSNQQTKQPNKPNVDDNKQLNADKLEDNHNTVNVGTNTDSHFVKDSAVQTNPQTAETTSTDTNDLISVKDEGVGETSAVNSPTTNNETQTTMNPTTETGVGDDLITDTIDTGIQVNPSQKDAATSPTQVNTSDTASGDDSVIEIESNETGTQTDSHQKSTNTISSQTENCVLDQSTMTNEISIKDGETQTEELNNPPIGKSEGTQTIQTVPTIDDASQTNIPVQKDEATNTVKVQVDSQVDTAKHRERINVGVQTFEPHKEVSESFTQTTLNTCDQATMTDKTGILDGSTQTEDLTYDVEKIEKEKKSTLTNKVEPPLNTPVITVKNEKGNSKSNVQLINEADPNSIEELPTNLHSRLTTAQNRLDQLSSDNPLFNEEKATEAEKALPQTGNKTSTLTTLAGLSLTAVVAFAALFSIKKKD